MERPSTFDLCNTEIAPGIRCGHRVEDHILHGPSLLECWRCDDWHHFVVHPNPRRKAA